MTEVQFEALKEWVEAVADEVSRGNMGQDTCYEAATTRDKEETFKELMK